MLGVGWDGMGWAGLGWDGMGWDGMGWEVQEISLSLSLFAVEACKWDGIGSCNEKAVYRLVS